MTSSVVFFPFDLFGSAGAGAGAQLLADEFREILADNDREQVPTRARAYQDNVRVHEFSFETLEAYQSWRQQGRRAARLALRRGAFLLWIAGNHLGVLPVYDELAASKRKTLVLQFDAHLDIHHFADCTPELSHGNFLLHCDGPLPHLINVGHRELLLCPDYVSKYYGQTFSAADLALDPSAALQTIRAASQAAERVVIDIDCDVFATAHFPAVTNPVPFGLDPALLLRFLEAAWSDRVAAVALSEFDPARDRNDQSLSALVWLLEYLLLKRHEGT